MADPSVLTRIGDRLRGELGAERVIVYGSVARGEATIHSDIDLLVVAPSEESIYHRMARAHAVMRDLTIGLPISPLVFTPTEIQRRLSRGDHFVRDILVEGIDV